MLVIFVQKCHLKNHLYEYITHIPCFSVSQNSTSPYCYTSTLSFTAVAPSDAGQYLFLVKSARGLAEASIVLSTALAKDSPGSHSNVVITPTSGTPRLETVGSMLLLVLLVLCWNT
jgi:hypothetical protein